MKRIRLTRDVERFPHFIAPKGATGTVVGTNPDRVRMDALVDGCEEWDNEITWTGENHDRMSDDCEPINDGLEEIARLLGWASAHDMTNDQSGSYMPDYTSAEPGAKKWLSGEAIAQAIRERTPESRPQLTDEVIEESLNAALLVIQKHLGIETGDYASHHWCPGGPGPFASYAEIMRQYERAERNCG